MTDDSPEYITPIDIAQFIEKGRCDRYLKLAVDPEGEDTARDWEEANTVGNLGIFGDGNVFEAQTVEDLAKDARTVIAPEPTGDTSVPGRPNIAIDETWNDADASRGPAQQIREAARNIATKTSSKNSKPPYALLFQAPLTGSIGAHQLSGAADIIILTPPDTGLTANSTQIPAPNQGSSDEDTDANEERSGLDAGDPAATQAMTKLTMRLGDSQATTAINARVIDCKSASEERPAHRVQVTLYCLLLNDLLAEDASLPHQIDGAVLTKDEANMISGPSDIEGFGVRSWKLLVEELLAEDGRISTILDTPVRETDFTINNTCENCKFNEACCVRATEQIDSQASLSLLGVEAGTQKELRDAGIDSIATLADVFERPENPSPVEQPQFTGEDPEQITELEQIFSGPVHEYVQRAQALRGEFDPNYKAYEAPPAIKGTGYVPLPADDHEDWGNLGQPEGTLIHVPLIVRPDTTINRIASLGACVTAQKYDDGHETLGHLINAVPREEKPKNKAERDLLTDFITDLFERIETVASRIGDPENAVIHFYTYTEYEEEELIDALDRHEDEGVVQALRDLLSLRASGPREADQAIISTVLPILDDHFALKQPSQDLLAVNDQFASPKTGNNNRNPRTWGALDPKGIRPGEPHLRKIFHYKFLNRRIPIVEDGSTVRAVLGDYAGVDTDGSAALRKRSGTQFPLEYIWAVTPESPGDSEPRLTPDVVEDWGLTDPKADDDYEALYQREIEQFRERTLVGDETVQRKDVVHLVERLSISLAGLIDSIGYKDKFMKKKTLDATELAQFSLNTNSDQFPPGENQLISAVKDYLYMETGSRKSEVEQEHRQSLRSRLQTGNSVPIRCEDITLTEDDDLKIDAELAYDTIIQDEETAAQFARQTRLKGSDGTSGGDWRVITPLGPPQPNSEKSVKPTLDHDTNISEYIEYGISKQEEIKKSPPVIVEDINLDDGSITLTALAGRFVRNDSFGVAHRGWTSPKTDNAPAGEKSTDNDPIHIKEDGIYVLDRMVDDLTGSKAVDALDSVNIKSNTLIDQLRTIRKGSSLSPGTAFSPRDVDEVIEVEERAPSIEEKPNPKQKHFIGAVQQPFSILQGPPGTGKTCKAGAPAILARAYSGALTNPPFAGVVTAPSNTAVDEVLADTAETLTQYQSTIEDFPQVNLVRVVASDAVDQSNPAFERDAVTICSYTSEAGEAKLQEIAQTYWGGNEPQTTLSTASPPCLLFVTPSTLHSVLGIAAETLDSIDGSNATAAMRHTPGLADLLFVDEASMVDLPRLFLAGSVLKETGQTLMVGDHRQLGTIQHHDWETERRRPIQKQRPHLSALDYALWITEELGQSTSPNRGKP